MALTLHQMFFLTIQLLSLFLSSATCATNQLEVMNEQELRQLITDEDYVVALFSNEADCTGRCEELEDTLASIREDIVEALNAWVVRTHSPTLSIEYGLNTKKTGGDIIFVRKGFPLLYTGPADDDEYLLHYLITNPESSVHTLSDENFEHLTQAATGATTGDWLVMFVRSDCNSCLILFRQGRLYRYMLPLVDATTLEHFASDGFRNARGENVPHPKTPFDDFTEWCADWLRENPDKVYLVLGILTTVVLGLVFYCIRSSRSAAEAASKKANKKKK
ncbi:uncharacterized protein LOC127006427 [Eriocheir sinensis]|uniref:uncharacterized protein LOC127006427 n=1 Tax=Eriocheir sinensis TaxID=95602 RepID=UPI0021C96637|nr:uncharacterized protein LOC127006427 [Eriocheir sinensis]